MPDHNDTTLSDAEYHELTKDGRRKWSSTDPIHQAPPEPADPDNPTVEELVKLNEWRHR